MTALPKILLVNDEERFRTNLGKMLAAEGCEVTIRDSGQGALDELTRQPYDVVPLDMRMPDMNGLETLAAIKKAHPDTEVTILPAMPRWTRSPRSSAWAPMSSCSSPAPWKKSLPRSKPPTNAS
jgi:CheY-like chemotaxis protein